MKCQNCFKEFDATKGDCPYCGAVPEQEATILNNNEKNNYNGLTVSGDGDDFYSGANDNDDYQNGRTHPRITVKTYSFGSGGFLTQIIVVLISALAIFILLPAFIFVFLILLAVWFLYRLLFR